MFDIVFLSATTYISFYATKSKRTKRMHFDNYESLNNIKISIIHFGIIESYVVSLMKKIRVYFSIGNKGVYSIQI
jgi:hypothetical protein